jgi:hypothetical protein
MAEERKVALVTGITGQDGSYLAELLLEKGYTVSHLPNDNVLLLSSLSSALFPGKRSSDGDHNTMGIRGKNNLGKCAVSMKKAFWKGDPFSNPSSTTTTNACFWSP